MTAAQEWRIHLGAHKTATTHLQDTLGAHREALNRHGVDFLPGARFNPLLRRFSRPKGFRRALWRHWPAPVRREFLRDLDRLCRDAGTVLVSDEDFLGYSQDQLAEWQASGVVV